MPKNEKLSSEAACAVLDIISFMDTKLWPGIETLRMISNMLFHLDFEAGYSVEKEDTDGMGNLLFDMAERFERMYKDIEKFQKTGEIEV